MFRGIDPEGLLALATATEHSAQAIRSEATSALALLGRRRLTTARQTLGPVWLAVESWGENNAVTLRWRADAIRSGQGAGFDVLSIMRAQFAAEAVFTAKGVEDSYHDWLREEEASWERSSRAVESISSWLHESWTDDVSNSDLHNITASLDELSSEELDRVIAALSPAQLELWIAEMGHHFNGFSRAEKQEVFSQLSEAASGASLGRIHDAILVAGGREDMLDFGVAIRDLSPDRAIVDFVEYAIAQELGNRRYSALAPALAVAGVDRTSAVDEIAGAIVGADGYLGLLVLDSYGADDGRSRNATPAMVSTLNRTTDIESRSSLFVALARLATTRDGERDKLATERRRTETKYAAAQSEQLYQSISDDMLDAAATLMERDPNGVVEQLATELDSNGSITSDFWEQLVSRGRADTIGRILHTLRGGESVEPASFSAAGSDPEYPFPHAGNLAFTAGTLNIALLRHADEASDDIDSIVTLAGIITAATGLVDIAAVVAGTVFSVGTDVSVSAYGDHTKRDLDTQLRQLIDNVTTSLRPGEDIPSEDIASGAFAEWIAIYTRLSPYG